MKGFLILVGLVCMNSVFAQGMTDLKSGDLALSQAQARIVDVKKICEPNADGASCRAYGSVVKIKVTMNGCIDHLGGTFSHFTEVEGKGVLSFGAVNISNKASQVTRCVQAPSEIVTVGVPFEGEIELAAMNFKGANSEEQ